MCPLVVENNHEAAVDARMRALGLCGTRDDSGRRCFLKAGHEGRCTFLRVSPRGPHATVVLPDARRGHDG